MNSVIIPVDEVETVRALRMAGDLGLLPRGEVGVELFQRVRRLGLEAGDFVANRDRVVAVGERAQFLDLGLELGHAFLKVEIAAHQGPRDS